VSDKTERKMIESIEKYLTDNQPPPFEELDLLMKSGKMRNDHKWLPAYHAYKLQSKLK
jgi:hypothetical protein